MMLRLNLLLSAVICVALCSCDRGPERVPTFPVTGQVLLDGKPTAGIRVVAKSTTGVDKDHPLFPQAETDAEGKFALFSYVAGDGVPNGEYKLTFEWFKKGPNPLSTGPDQFGGKYADPKDSKTSFTVKGEPVDVGTIELTTK